MFNSGFGFSPYYKQAGLLAGLKSKFNLSAILNNTQKTLNIVNQAIPLAYQVKPMINNAKTVFKIMGAMKSDDDNNVNSKNKNSNDSTTVNNVNTNINNTSVNQDVTNYQENINQPVFFL